MHPNATQLVEALLRCELPIEPVLEGLSQFPFDPAEELAELRVDHVLAVLERYMSGALTAEQVADWADRIEMRDDIGIEAEHADILRDSIFALANPAINEAVTPESARRMQRELAPEAKS